jgi:hypothetical protein
MTKELKEAITSIHRLNPSPGWLDRNIEEAKKSLPPTEEQLAAARLAGKIEGMEECLAAVEEASERPIHSWDVRHVDGVRLGVDRSVKAIRAKIAELEATTTPALPGSSEPA